MDSGIIIPNIISVFIGAIITWFASWFYYARAGNDLNQEAKEIRRPSSLILHGLEDAGLVQLNRDASGVIRGLVVGVGARLSGKGRLSAKVSVNKTEALQ